MAMTMSDYPSIVICPCCGGQKWASLDGEEHPCAWCQRRVPDVIAALQEGWLRWRL